MTFEEILKTKKEIKSLQKLEYIEKFTFKGHSSLKDYKVFINKENQVLIVDHYKVPFSKKKILYYIHDKIDLEEKDIECFKKSKENQLKRNWFFEFVNLHLKNKFIKDLSQLKNQELKFDKGTEEDFLNRVQNIIWADNKTKQYPVEISFSSQTEEEKAKIDEYDNLSRETISLLESALDEFNPTGFSWEYKDGPNELRSSYYNCPHYLYYEIEKPNPHEKLDAKLKIKK